MGLNTGIAFPSLNLMAQYWYSISYNVGSNIYIPRLWYCFIMGAKITIAPMCYAKSWRQYQTLRIANQNKIKQKLERKITFLLFLKSWINCHFCGISILSGILANWNSLFSIGLVWISPYPLVSTFPTHACGNFVWKRGSEYSPKSGLKNLHQYTLI